MEFEEMWGATAPAPNPAMSKFGKYKSNNTPHQLKVGGKWLECYFSPSDNVNVEITNRIKSAESDLSAAVMTFTRKEMAYAIEDAVDAGADASFLTSSFSNLIFTSGGTVDSTVFKVLKNSCHQLGDYTGGGFMHNKYLIVDQGNTASDPLVLTGSHNWTASANNFNDENTIVIHDATLANIFYQNFVKIMSMADILYGIDDFTGKASQNVRIYPNPAHSTLNIDFQSNERSSYTVMIYSLSGRVVNESTHQISQGMNNIALDISGTEPGLFLIKIFNMKSSYSQKLIIQ